MIYSLISLIKIDNIPTFKVLKLKCRYMLYYHFQRLDFIKYIFSEAYELTMKLFALHILYKESGTTVRLLQSANDLSSFGILQRNRLVNWLILLLYLHVRPMYLLTCVLAKPKFRHAVLTSLFCSVQF